MTSILSIWSLCHLKNVCLLRKTCPLLKYSSNFKPQAHNMCNLLLSNSPFLHYQKKFNSLSRSNWCKSFVNFNLIKRNHLFCSERFLSYNLNCSRETLLKLPDSLCCKAFSRNSTVVSSHFIKNMFPRYYSIKKPVVNNKHLAIKKHEYIKGILREKQRRIRQTQLHLKSSGQLLLNDIKETKSKMKVKMEEIIEVK